MRERFVIVFSADDAEYLEKQGFKIVKEDKKNNICVLCNVLGKEKCLEGITHCLTNKLSF